MLLLVFVVPFSSHLKDGIVRRGRPPPCSQSLSARVSGRVCYDDSDFVVELLMSAATSGDGPHV